MRKFLTVVGAVVVILVIIIGVGRFTGGQQTPGPGPGGPGQAPAPSQPEAQNPPGCVAHEVIAAPGTWESRADDDPVHPTANPNSLMFTVTGPLQEAYGPEDVKVWTVPYPAQFRNIQAQNELSYDDSRAQGYSRVEDELRAMHDACPATRFILTGFSQGAVIMGDMASEIGNGRGPVPADRVEGVALIADGRRDEGSGTLVGSPAVTGIGAEIALHPVSGLVQPIIPGATMRGPRPGGFGELQPRVTEFCDPADLVCSAPRDIGNALQRAQDLVSANAVHAQYATNGGVVEGTTVPRWIVDWARGIIDG
ncbi:cutinase family protein [Corynebacterium bovis]|uniref:Carbohydrate esterase n=2 Tax=Corynebacterium bovis TaxID=36808 RepID=A0A3R8QQI7_9CORY|nr:cutinase family protein [Corynebacterium bovis]RRO90981.1 carbohydrate esterase [Corynebacterium bovis]RRO93859.1 carbohydrate esterase [Corynebacterium bovis]RRO99613.1 carbohydrate esterase [Corynebacterium bovis]RRQ03334.1 carbohydrate esterase [Corynebacterium bovis]RRQ03729.1 carbohydrate esterase [Corynebacterium bovis]